MFLLILLYTFSALSFTVAKGVLDYGAPIFFVGVRMFGAGVMLLLYLACRHRQLLVVQKKDWPWFAAMAFVHIYLAFVLDLVALQYMSSSKGAFLYNLSPFIAALFSYFFFHEKMTLLKWVGLGIGFAGFVPELLAQSKQGGSFFMLAWPDIMMLASAAAAVLGWTMMRKLVKQGYSPMTINGYAMLGGGLLALVNSFFTEVWNPFPVTDWYRFTLFTIVSIFIANICFYNLYGYLLRVYTATFLSFAGFVVPLITAFFGWIFLGESIHLSFFLSLSVVVIGLTLFYYQELKQGYIQ